MVQYVVGVIVKNRGFEESKISPEIMNNKKQKLKKSSPDKLFQFVVNKAAFSKTSQFCRRISKCKVKVLKNRSSHRRCSVKKDVLKNFLKKRLQHRSFPVKFAKFLKASILKNLCERLPLKKEGVLTGILLIVFLKASTFYKWFKIMFLKILYIFFIF